MSFTPAHTRAGWSESFGAAREYAAAVVVLAAFGMSAWREANAVILVGDGLIGLATLFVVPPARAMRATMTRSGVDRLS